MAEYIDKEKLLQKLSRMIDYCKTDSEVNGLTALFQVGDAIMDCPTVEFVKCRDCQYCVESDKTNRNFCAYHGKDMEIYLDDFCSCGVERHTAERGVRVDMLEPKVKLTNEHHFCTCGKPNFRCVNDTKPFYKIYEVEIPQRVYGTQKFYLCEDCLKLLNPNNEVIK